MAITLLPDRTCTSTSTCWRSARPPRRRSPTGTCTGCTITNTSTEEDDDGRGESEVGREESAAQDGARQGQDPSPPRAARGAGGGHSAGGDDPRCGCSHHQAGERQE